MQSSDTPTTIDSAASTDAVLRLVPALDLSRAEALHAELRSLATSDAGMVIDGSHVEIVSTSCLQLLVAAATDARRRGVTFRLQPRSEVLQQAVEDLGLVMYLHEEMAG